MKRSNAMAIPLPTEYALLERFFNAVESSLYCQKKAALSFSELRVAVESTVRKTFKEEQLGKLLTVFPDAFQVRRDPKTDVLYVSLPSGRGGTGALGFAQESLNRRKQFKENLLELLSKSDEIAPQVLSQLAEDHGYNQASHNSKASLTPMMKVAQGGSTSCKRKHEGESVDETQQAQSKENKRRNVSSELKGLPLSLIANIKIRREKEKLLDPALVAERQRIRAVESLPSLFDLIYVHFRSIKKNKCDVEKLLDLLAQNSGGRSEYRPSGQCNDQRALIKEQLAMLLQRVPEFCQLR